MSISPPRTLRELLRDLRELRTCVQHYERQDRPTEAAQSRQDFQGLVEEIAVRFQLTAEQMTVVLQANGIECLTPVRPQLPP